MDLANGESHKVLLVAWVSLWLTWWFEQIDQIRCDQSPDPICSVPGKMDAQLSIRTLLCLRVYFDWGGCRSEVLVIRVRKGSA
jgi:hypothetical protein